MKYKCPSCHIEMEALFCDCKEVSMYDLYKKGGFLDGYNNKITVCRYS